MEGVEDGENVVARQRSDEFHSLCFKNIDDGIGDSHGVPYLVPAQAGARTGLRAAAAPTCETSTELPSIACIGREPLM